jgi:3-carboxy-cis,cis-muconate cycloisomerase
MNESVTSLRVAEPGIRALFTQDSQWQAWLDVEVALAHAEAELGMIPADAAQAIEHAARLELLDRERIVTDLARTGHALVPVVWELSRICKGDAGHYVHWGATTQNILDSAEMLLLRRANRIYLDLTADILDALADLATRTRSMAAAGRTHGQHAVPITFGFKVAGWIDELARDADRLLAAESDQLFVAMLGGAAGTFASFGDQGIELQQRFAALLDMQAMSLPSRSIQDRFADYSCRLALLSTSCGRIGGEIYTLMKQEFGEAREPVPAGTVGSSTMPQKRNPILSQDLLTGAAEIRTTLPLALEAMQSEHEANRANTQMMRRATHRICEGLGDMLARVLVIARGLTVDEQRMRENLDLTGGLILAEALMLELGRHVGRQDAHDIVYEVSEQAFAPGSNFSQLLAADSRITEHLSTTQIDALLDPTLYTGQCALLADEQAALARSKASAIRAR